jgi:hypothetical protein
MARWRWSILEDPEQFILFVSQIMMLVCGVGLGVVFHARWVSATPMPTPTPVPTIPYCHAILDSEQMARFSTYFTPAQ